MTRSHFPGVLLLVAALILTLYPVGGLNVICWVAAVIFFAHDALHRTEPK